MNRTRILIGAGLLLATLGSASAVRWTEEDFVRKGSVVHPYMVIPSADAGMAQTVIGSTRFYHVRKGDTFLDLARFYGLGYNEIEQANPGVDPWIPPEGQVVVLPTEWVLPQSSGQGVVVNIPEMRLYFFHPRKEGQPQMISTYPVGLGRDEWRTPTGKFKIRGKTLDPTWNIPDSIIKERLAEGKDGRKTIPGGDPENPLGRHRIELSFAGSSTVVGSYGIHGTNIPWGVGMQVSHGCIRLYPEDIEQLFQHIQAGMPGELIYQPVKIGARAGRIYAEVHPDIYRMTPGLYREAIRVLDSLGWTHRVDARRLQRAIEEQSGVPLDITAGAGNDLHEEDLRSVGQPPFGRRGS